MKSSGLQNSFIISIFNNILKRLDVKRSKNLFEIKIKCSDLRWESCSTRPLWGNHLLQLQGIFQVRLWNKPRQNQLSCNNNMHSFFCRRSLQNNTSAKYLCRRRSDCDINCKTRRNCQYCRSGASMLVLDTMCNSLLQIYEMSVHRNEPKLRVDRRRKEEEVSQRRQVEEREKEPRSSGWFNGCCVTRT